MLRKLKVSPDETPVVIWRGEEVLRNPTKAELGRMIGLRALADGPRDCDLLIVGAGPAASRPPSTPPPRAWRRSCSTRSRPEGADRDTQIENYLGFPAGISGTELADRALVQARSSAPRSTSRPRRPACTRTTATMVELEDGTEVPCRARIARRAAEASVPRLEEVRETSVFAATPMEARFCENVPVTIVGGGNAAGRAAIFVCERTSRAT